LKFLGGANLAKKIINIIADVLFAFFAIIFILGFFSEQIIDIFMPKVNIMIPRNSEIVRSVECKGIIKPNEVYKVEVPIEMQIESYFVKKGERVSQSQKIFKVRNINDLIVKLEEVNQYLKDEKEKNATLVKSIKEEIQRERRDNLELKKLVRKKKEKESLINFGDCDEMELEKIILNASIIQSKIGQLEEKKDLKLAQNKMSNNEIKKYLELKEKLEKWIEILNEGQGYYLAESEGVIYNLNEKYALKEGESVLEITSIDDYEDVKIKTTLTAEQFKKVGELQLLYAYVDGKKKKAYIDDLYTDELGNVFIEAYFYKEFDSNIVLGSSYDCKLEYKKRFMGTMTLPKSVIKAPIGFEEGTSGSVFVARREEGILGEEYFVDEEFVDMIVVGDYNVITEPLKNPYVITTVDDRIKKGKKIFLEK
jgi:hypothetical protein